MSLTFRGHVMSSFTCPFDTPYAISYWWSYETVSEIFNVECNATIDMNFIRPLNKGQGHSFWYQLISYTRLPIEHAYVLFSVLWAQLKKLNYMMIGCQ